MNAGPSYQDAAVRRQEMLDNLERIVALCSCLWPLRKYRNGDGHDDDCPAHVPLDVTGRGR